MTHSSKDWIKKYALRSDSGIFLTHLTRANNTFDALEVLVKILREKRIVGSTTQSGYIVGTRPAVCFQEAPLYSIAQSCYQEMEKHKTNEKYQIKYAPFGLQFHKWNLYGKGGRPVFYEKTDIAKTLLPSHEHWRIVDLDLANPNSLTDWTHEREWRVPGNLDFEYSEVYVVVNNSQSYQRLVGELGSEIISKIQGITLMNQVFA